MHGRAQWYTITFVFYIISNIVIATANNYNISCQSSTLSLYYAGANILDPITIVDLTNVVDRGLIQGLYNVPGFINHFVASRVGDPLFDAGQRRWGYSSIPIILFITALTLVGNL